MKEINGIRIIDYVDMINPEKGRKYTKEDLDEIMNHFSELRKKFGIVFDISSYRTNKSDEDDKD